MRPGACSSKLGRFAGLDLPVGCSTFCPERRVKVLELPAFTCPVTPAVCPADTVRCSSILDEVAAILYALPLNQPRYPPLCQPPLFALRLLWSQCAGEKKEDLRYSKHVSRVKKKGERTCVTIVGCCLVALTRCRWPTRSVNRFVALRCPTLSGCHVRGGSTSPECNPAACRRFEHWR